MTYQRKTQTICLKKQKNSKIVNHTFTKQEYKEFIEAVFHAKGYKDDFKYLEELYDLSIYWERKISGINHFLCVVLEQFAKKEIETLNIIEFVYSLPDICNFEIQESSERFLDTLFEHTINPALDLDDQLILIQNKLS
jgi:hypothetical protein